MFKLITFTMALLTSPFAPAWPADAGTDLCCHYHDDGSEGCWPAATSNVECDWIQPCEGGAAQTDPDDEESWACTSPRVS